MTDYFETITDTLSSSDSIIFAGSKKITDILSGSDSLKFGGSKKITDILSGSDSLKFGGSKKITDTLSSSDSLKFGGSKKITDILSGSDSIFQFLIKDLSGNYTKSIKVSKSWADQLWSADLEIIGTTIPEMFSIFKLSMTDKESSSSENIFLGFVPGADYILKKNFETIKIKAFDYSWYLSAQYVPSAYKNTDESINPSTLIRNLLGGDLWRETTGIYPIRIEDVPSWVTYSKQFSFDPYKITKWKAIQEICEYTNMIFIIYWKYQPIPSSTAWLPCAFFLTETQWDDVTNQGANGASASDKTIDANTSNIPLEFSYQKEDIQGINRVRAIVQDEDTGTFYEGVSETSSVTAKTEIAREKIWGPYSGTWTQTTANSKATSLLSEYGNASETFKAKLQASSKLRLGQKIRFQNVSSHPTDWMRITNISHSGEVVNEITEIEYAKLVTLKLEKERTERSSMYKEIRTITTNEAEALANRLKSNDLIISKGSPRLILDNQKIATRNEILLQRSSVTKASVNLNSNDDLEIKVGVGKVVKIVVE